MSTNIYLLIYLYLNMFIFLYTNISIYTSGHNKATAQTAGDRSINSLIIKQIQRSKQEQINI